MYAIRSYYAQIVQAIVGQVPDAPSSLNPQVSQGLERIILKCLRKDPADRYASAGELLADLARLEAGDISGLTAGPPAARAERRVRRRPAYVAAASLLRITSYNVCYTKLLRSCLSEIPGLDELVMARLPHAEAPYTMLIAATSLSAWIKMRPMDKRRSAMPAISSFWGVMG